MRILTMRKRVTDALALWFPDREFFMRSQGQIKFVKVSARLQMTVAGAVVAALLLWLVITLAMLVSQYSISMERMALVQRQAEIESSASRVKAYRSSVEDVAQDLEKRQAFLEDIVTSYIGEQAASEDASAVVGSAEQGSSDEAAKTARKISAMVPEAAGLARMEARQIAFVERLTRAATVRARNAEQAIRKFGLNPETVARASASAQGGPFIPFKGSGNARLDPRFTALGQTLARMDALERGLVAIPSGTPALAPAITSGFGYRRDPFTGAAALHSGIDFKARRIADPRRSTGQYRVRRRQIGLWQLRRSGARQRSGHALCSHVVDRRPRRPEGRQGRAAGRHGQHRSFHRHAPPFRGAPQ